MEEKKGVIYILTNPSFPDYVKIGYADNVEERVKQLNSSECTPFAFRIYATYEVESRLLDKKIHTIIDKLNPKLRSIDDYNGQKRVREFYAMSAEDAYDIFEAIAEINNRKEKQDYVITLRPANAAISAASPKGACEQRFRTGAVRPCIPDRAGGPSCSDPQGLPWWGGPASVRWLLRRQS